MGYRVHCRRIKHNRLKNVHVNALIERNFSSTDCKGSNGRCWGVLSTRVRSQESLEGGREGFKEPWNPPKEPNDQVVLSYRLSLHGVVISRNSSNLDFKGYGRQPSLQPLLQKGKHNSDRASPGVLSVRRTPLDEQVPLQGISVSHRWCLC